MKYLFFSLFFLSFAYIPAKAQLSNLPEIPREVLYSQHNDDFTVCVREPGGDWQDLYEYKVMVDSDNPQPASMVQFDFTGMIEMRVRVNNGLLSKVTLRPGHQNIPFRQEGKFIYLTLDKPAKLSLEINDDRLHNLHIFANKAETQVPSPDTPGVMYFAPGYHKPAEDTKGAFVIPSNTTVYLAPGAFLNGKILCHQVENVKIIGRGYIIQPERGIEITFSKNIEINGITVINPTHYTVYGGQSTGIKINNLKSFSSRGWSDGIDLMSCSDVTINDIFMRNSDDCITIYTHRWDYYGDARNYRVTNAILWADVAHPINIGLHGNTESETGETIENIHFSEVDILEHDEDDRNYQGCMAFSVSDNNFVQNVTFENVRIDDIQEGQLFNLRALFNEKYSKAPGRGVKNVLFKNIYYTGSGVNPSVIHGFDEKRQIEDIRFENVVINGKRAKSQKEIDLRIGQYTQNITVK